MINRLFNLKGLNFWLLGTAIGFNLFWALLVVVFGYAVINQNRINRDFIQASMLVACFAGPFLIGWIVAKMAADLRGPSYGLIGSFGGLIPIVVVLVPGGLFGIIVAFSAVLGGFNGGLMAMRHLDKNK